MSTATAPDPVRITGYGVLSAAGVGGKALYEAVRSGALPAGDGGAAALSGAEPPPLRLLPVPDFSPQEYLGRKGLSSLSRTSALGMAAAGLALDALSVEEEPAPHPDTGVVLGTSTGSARAFTEFLRDTYEQRRPYHVSPALFPGLLLNHAAGQTAMRHAFTGVNATLAGGHVSSLSALRYARNALVTGQAARLLAGGVEELSAQSAWAWHRSGVLGRDGAVGEGSAVFVIERGTHGTTIAELASCEAGFSPLEDGPLAAARALARCIGAALRAGGARPEDVDVVCPGAPCGRGWGAVESRGRRRALAGHAPEVLRVREVLGETYSAGGGLQLAVLLAHWEANTAPGTGSWGLVTSVGSNGSVAAALLRRPSGGI
ncbi:beta-ketoacyl synthase N-terminal-like domain-containing protein [Streptomyces sp. NPDC001262]|uniref:beta-ketoacyl synthase N-terminal-like domain-containing protein n=1 Tax=unclassified Streptomyces TaxID=2593676 RepID=UPI00368E8EF4